MVKRANSNRVKAHLREHNKEVVIKRALTEYTYKQAKPANSGKPKSIANIAEAHGISYGTLHCHIKGGKSRQEAHASQQKLTSMQEWSLVQFICESANMGFLLTHRQIAEYANAV
ncbi:unnamed protein product [Mycena citricolor]|uniref:HTH psq-type domain-containing protein n=1 Tax=Mycena citricolor TaxID=2018698 RepID=A0AAD2GYV1_9AGAR|nr:unnamed protein product [Mycena citricolor]